MKSPVGLALARGEYIIIVMVMCVPLYTKERWRGRRFLVPKRENG